MKDKIFDYMLGMGWNLFDNTYEDFDNVLQEHKSKIEYMLSECPGTGERRIDLANWTAYINNSELANIFEFMCDFIESINHIDKFEKREK